MKKILFLISDTGGGHRAAARAIEEAIEYLHPGQYESIIVDVWKEHMVWPIRLVPDTYAWITGPGRLLWALLWKVSSYHRMQRLLFDCCTPLVKDSVARYISNQQPDLAVSVHPLMNHLGVIWLETAGLRIPLITVVTDMVSFHPSWICPEVDHCIVPTREAWQRAVRYGMPKEKLAVHGQPVGLKFARFSGDKQASKRRLGIDPLRPAILMVGGGEGQGQMYRIARRIAASIDQGQLLIVAGRNRRLQQRLEQVNWEIPTRVFGFVDNMPELMAAADLLITKAGPGTISEAFISGLPLLLNDFIPGQEAGNVLYVLDNGAGAYAPRTRDIIAIIRDWMAGGSQVVQELARNASGLARPNASLDIATDICRFA